VQRRYFAAWQAATVAHVEELRNEIRALGKEPQARENSDDHA
jgi:hypothetical protein